MAQAGGGKGGSNKSGSGGNASNAALHDDEDLMFRRKVLFGEWKNTRKKRAEVHPGRLIEYENSPQPPTKRS